MLDIALLQLRANCGESPSELLSSELRPKRERTLRSPVRATFEGANEAFAIDFEVRSKGLGFLRGDGTIHTVRPFVDDLE